MIYYAPIFFSDANREFVVADLETTGLNEERDQILEFGALLIRDGQIVSEFNTLVCPSVSIPKEITDINGITNEMVKDAPKIREALQNFLIFVGKRLIVGHNWERFDNKWIRANSQFWFGQSFWNRTLDTIKLANFVFPVKKSKDVPFPKDEQHPDGYDIIDHKLQTLATFFGINPGTAHRAVDDCMTNFKVLIELEKLMNPQFADVIQKYYYPSKKEEEIIF